MTPGELSNAIVAAVRGAIAAGELPLPGTSTAVPAPEAVPLRAAHGGDGYATPLAFRLATAADRPVAEVAAVLAKRLSRTPGVRTVRVTGPGVLTIALRTPGALVREIIEMGERYTRPVPPAPSTPVWPMRPLTFDNPGFLVRYAHVRAVAVARHARQLGMTRGAFDAALLDAPRERVLLTLLGELPQWAAQATRTGDPSVFARRLERVADEYHHVYERCPALPRGDEEATPMHHARLWLAEAVRVAVASGLRGLGEVPPERL